MNRNEASQLLRKKLDENKLTDWHVRLNTNTNSPFLGLCSYKDKAIILNAHHIDQHPDIEIQNTIAHEVAHALCIGHQHDSIWAAKARELGCDNPTPCVAYSLSPYAIDAIRSGAELVITFEEETIRKPKSEIKRLQDHCAVCGKVLKQASVVEYLSGKARWKRITYDCGHFIIRKADSQTLFENFITAEHRNNNCKHTWDKNHCTTCDAYRPFSFQADGMRALEKSNGRLGIFDEMGLGKTIQALGFIQMCNAFPALYVVKSGIKYQWLQQIVTWHGPQYFAQVLRSSKENFLPGLKNYIISYDILRRLDTDKLKRLIEVINPKTLVLDECQLIKNPDSTRTQEVRKLAKQIPNIIPLSGTPWKNRGSEFFVALNMLDSKRFWSFKSFNDTWVDHYWDGNKYKEGGIRNPKKFKEYVADLLIRRERTEVMPELPLISRNKLIAEVPDNVRQSYQEAEDRLIKDLDQFTIDGREDSFEAKKAMMDNLIIMRQIVGLAKVPATVEFVQDFLDETDRKLVVFVHHKECARQILIQMQAWCAANNQAQPLSLTSNLSSEERYDIQVKFNSPSHRLMIASTLASGEGLNLQTCSDCVMHERQWNPANEEQAEGRFIRIGQLASAVSATYVHGDDTIDTILDHIVERKRVAFHNAMNKGEMPGWSEDSIISELVNGIRIQRKNRR